jgi:hypothetical protein
MKPMAWVEKMNKWTYILCFSKLTYRLKMQTYAKQGWKYIQIIFQRVLRKFAF